MHHKCNISSLKRPVLVNTVREKWLFHEILCVLLGENPPEAQGPRHPRHLRLRGLRAERVRTADHQLQQREGPAAGHRLGLQAGAGGHRPAGTGMDPGIYAPPWVNSRDRPVRLQYTL
jgi:hypothetical protein